MPVIADMCESRSIGRPRSPVVIDMDRAEHPLTARIDLDDVERQVVAPAALDGSGCLDGDGKFAL